MQINSTELCGFVAFMPAGLASAAAWAVARERPVRMGWGILTVAYVLLSIEILASARHQVDQAIGQWLRVEHLYPERRPAQAGAILVLVVLALLAGTFTLRRAPTALLKIATGTTAAVLTLFVVESVSLHAVDAVLYHPVGPVMLIGWLWLACGWTTVTAATLRLFNNGSRGIS